MGELLKDISFDVFVQKLLKAYKMFSGTGPVKLIFYK